MIYELDKHGYKYDKNSYMDLAFGFLMEVFRTNEHSEKLKKYKDLDEILFELGESNELDFLKMPDKKSYIAIVLFKDYIDFNKIIHDYLMKIISYLNDNYSTGCCEKLVEFFQDPFGYYLIFEGKRNDEIDKDDSLNLSGSNDLSSDEEEKKEDSNGDNKDRYDFFRNIFREINKDLEIRHKFGIYDFSYFPTNVNIETSHFNKNTFRPPQSYLSYNALINQINMRYNAEILYKQKNEEIIAPEIRKKIEKIEEKELYNIKKIFKRMEDIFIDVNEKTELYNIGRAMQYLAIKSYEDDDIDERITDENFKSLIKSLTKENPEERLTWNEYINHSFFKEGFKKTDYEYELIKEIKEDECDFGKIIVLKDNTIITNEIIITNDYKILWFDECISTKYLFNLNELILTSKKDNEINILKLNSEMLQKYKNKELEKNEEEKNNISQVLEKIQAIDISYKEILPLSSLSNGKKDLVIYTSDKEITLWKYDGTKYSLTIKTKVEKCYFLLSEIKEEIALCVRENNDYLIDFYSFDKTFEKKKSLKCYADPSQLIMLSNDIMAIRIEGKIGLLFLADINKCQIVQTILFESSYYFLYVNKFNKILANILHDNQYSYTTFLREFSYENGCLYRRKTIGDIEPMSYAESENGLLIVGEKGRISIFK